MSDTQLGSRVVVLVGETGVSHAVRQRLSIYLTRDCPACETARVVAAQVEHARPNVCVELVYLEDGEIPPASVFGVPTYVWRGRVVSLGNPHLEDLLTLLSDTDERRGSDDIPNR